MADWDLNILVTDLQESRTLRVKGETHIGGLMLALVEELGLQLDWSDHYLFWPGRNKWLTRTRFTLDQYGVQSDAELIFTPAHKLLRVNLPDRRTIEMNVDFSAKMFTGVRGICSELGLRHPEELSLSLPLSQSSLSKNLAVIKPVNDVPYSELDPSELATAVHLPPSGPKPKGLLEKARMNVGWLDSSLSLMEQSVREHSTVLLRFKFMAFFDLNPGLDSVRINQLYEQARCSILNEEVDTSEEESLLFAALQLQCTLQASIAQPFTEEIDDIDSALDNLQLQLSSPMQFSPSAPSLKATLKVLRGSRKFTLKGFKSYEVECREAVLVFRSKGEEFSIGLRGAEVAGDAAKYGIKLQVDPGEDVWMRCEGEDQYASWLAACRLGSRGKSIADSSYQQEVKSIQTILAMQRRALPPAINSGSIDLSVEDYLASRWLKRTKSNKLQSLILSAHANVTNLSLVECKLAYIKAWHGLVGPALFIVRFTGSRKDELLGVAPNRIVRMDFNGERIETWRYDNMKAWNVNWEVKMMMIQLDEGNISFGVCSAPCKTVHEFIGGYIFLSLRKLEASQLLNEELFYKLTGGWSLE